MTIWHSDFQGQMRSRKEKDITNLTKINLSDENNCPNWLVLPSVLGIGRRKRRQADKTVSCRREKALAWCDRDGMTVANSTFKDCDLQVLCIVLKADVEKITALWCRFQAKNLKNVIFMFKLFLTLYFKPIWLLIKWFANITWEWKKSHSQLKYIDFHEAFIVQVAFIL